jgi:hypothetical protein
MHPSVDQAAPERELEIDWDSLDALARPRRLSATAIRGANAPTARPLDRFG